MLRKKKFAGIASLLAAVSLVAAACGSGGSGGGESGGNQAGGDGGGKGTITIPYITWAEDVALSNLYQQVLEEKGYTVELQQLDAGPIFASLADGSTDVFLDVWLPVTHKDYWKKYGDQLEDLGIWYDNASLDLAVPSYVKEVDSIADLKSHAEMFDGAITGIGPSAGETDVVQNTVIPEYGLEGTMDLKVSSTTAMLAALDSAIAAKEPIVVTLWHPHWAYSRYDLKDLKDPKGAMGAAEKLHFVARKGFTADYPSVAKSMKNFKINDKQLQSLEDTIQKAGKGNEAQGVKNWINDHQDFVDKYFGMIKQAK